MTLVVASRLFRTTIAAVTLMWADHSAVASEMVSLPYVGCSSFGQSQVLEPPKGTSPPVRISAQDAPALAYYKSADGIAVLAPRGWYCQGVSGSGGAALFLSPKPIVHTSSGWKGLDGEAIEVNVISGENSGRSEIAEIIARVFPAYRWYARQVEDPDSPLPTGPYPKDTLTYRGKAIVGYETPARTGGLGNFDSWLGINDFEIVGAAILLPGSRQRVGIIPHLVLLSIRFSADLASLAPTIVRYVEHESLAAAR